VVLLQLKEVRLQALLRHWTLEVMPETARYLQAQVRRLRRRRPP
jgi:hypothetical protein